MNEKNGRLGVIVCMRVCVLVVQTHTSLSHDFLPGTAPGLNAVNDQEEERPRPSNQSEVVRCNGMDSLWRFYYVCICHNNWCCNVIRQQKVRQMRPNRINNCYTKQQRIATHNSNLFERSWSLFTASVTIFLVFNTKSGIFAQLYPCI